MKDLSGAKLRDGRLDPVGKQKKIIENWSVQNADCRLQTGYKMQTRYKMQTADCRLQTGYKMQTKSK